MCGMFIPALFNVRWMLPQLTIRVDGHISAAILPVLLCAPLLASSSINLSEEHTKWQERREHAVMLMGRLDHEYRSLQRTYTLVKTGEEKAFTQPLIALHMKTSYESPQEEYVVAQERTESLEEGIPMLRRRLLVYGEKIIAIDLSGQRAALLEHGRIVARYPVSSGARITPTPHGSFQIYRKQLLRVSNLETPYRMPYYMAFTANESHGLHALPYLGRSPQSSDYWYEARSHIGIPVSHGCIRFLPEDAAKLYEWTEVGTQVLIHT